MGLLQPDSGLPSLRGGVLGGRGQSRAGGSWVSSNTQHAPRRRNRTLVGGRNFAPAIAAWGTLTPSEQALWDTFAETVPLYDRYTAPILSNGRQLFISFNTNLLFYGQGGSFVTVPPAAPTWGTVGAFQGKQEKDGTDIFTIASASFAAGAILAVYSQPPGFSDIRLVRSQMKYLGNVVFAGGLAAGDSDTSIGDLIAANYGAIVREFEPNLWSMIYEVQEGYMRLIGDPCYTDDGLAIFRITCTASPGNFVTATNFAGQSQFLFNNGLPSATNRRTTLWGPLFNGEEATVKMELPYPASQIVTIHAYVSRTPVGSAFQLGNGGPRLWTFPVVLP